MVLRPEVNIYINAKEGRVMDGISLDSNPVVLCKAGEFINFIRSIAATTRSSRGGINFGS